MIEKKPELSMVIISDLKHRAKEIKKSNQAIK